MTTRSGKYLEKALWAPWIERDDRSVLQNCADESWDPSYCLDALREVLHPIVTSVHFSGYSRWGVQPSKSSLESLLLDFTRYLKEDGEWKALHARWQRAEEKPFSLPLFLTRAYARFKAKHHPDRHDEQVGEGRDLSPVALVPGSVSAPLVDAFFELTRQLPEECRLIYQLHLEGLLDPEIALILRTDLGEVRERILEAKDRLDLRDFRKGVGA